MSHLKIAPSNQSRGTTAAAALLLLFYYHSPHDEKVKDYSRSASICESISGDGSIKDARERSSGRKRKKSKRRAKEKGEEGPRGTRSTAFRCPSYVAYSRASIRYASLGASSQDGINYPRISLLSSIFLSLFLFFFLSHSLNHPVHTITTSGIPTDILILAPRASSLSPSLPLARILPSSLFPLLFLLHLMAFRVLSRYADFTLPPFSLSLRRADGGRREAKESATLSLYTRRRRRRRHLPPSLSSRVPRRLSCSRAHAITLVFPAGKGLRLLAQAASTFARE